MLPFSALGACTPLGWLGEEELKPLVFLIDIFVFFIFFVFRICRTVRDWGIAVCWGGLGEVELKPVGRRRRRSSGLGSRRRRRRRRPPRQSSSHCLLAALKGLLCSFTQVPWSRSN